MAVMGVFFGDEGEMGMGWMGGAGGRVVAVFVVSGDGGHGGGATEFLLSEPGTIRMSRMARSGRRHAPSSMRERREEVWSRVGHRPSHLSCPLDWLARHLKLRPRQPLAAINNDAYSCLEPCPFWRAAVVSNSSSVTLQKY
jgi:hypothetical protein